MQVEIDELRPYVQAFDFPHLFVEGLGWDYYQGEPLALTVDGHEYALKPVAEKAGFAVYRCGPNADGAVPPQSVRRQIETRVAQINYEHLIVFVDAAETRQVWQWVKRESGKSPAIRELRYEERQSGTALLQRLRGIAFTLEEEGNLGITDVTGKILQSLDVERVTRRFYDRFREELAAFQKFIDGFTAQGDRDWYASLMLNRLMFVYFIQKQGFLDGDEHYLRHRLERIQEKDGPDRFQRFYHEFLLRLFHEGLGKPEADRPAELAALIGKVPYLNGGIFDQHALERDNREVNIPDNAFRQVFDFFDQYQWHLDDRPTGSDNEINPDVLGYIFEKYVNQKQMGAYYTKEDITGYIARNTVIPRLLEMAQAECLTAFAPEGGVWRLLQDDPDNYIYPSVGHGVAWDYSPDSITRLGQPLELPDNIAGGLEDTAKRGEWNRPAPEDYALPTETWRELIARRHRYEEVRGKLANGEVQSVNDLITLNLDSERFARDVIVNSEGPELVRAIWNALTRISVLDPACGSGAFLFAALNTLEPLYSATLQAMRGFLADLEISRRPSPPKALLDFREILDAAGQHRSERYYILKSIIVNNLYGVDIMEEAVEICRLRLFLKLAAQLESVDEVEPLPDIDFNIQPGNTLVGFTSLDAVRRAMTITETQDRPMPDVSRAVRGQQIRALDQEQQNTLSRIETAAGASARQHRNFQQIQTVYGMKHEQLAEAKQQLQSRLDQLRTELDALLSKEYGVDPDQPAPFQQWRNSHQPFHWFVEFHGIISNGGFQVVIGNPPYVEYSKVKNDYTVKGYETESCGNLYAFFVERNAVLVSKSGRTGMIVPHSAICTDRMAPFQKQLLESKAVWISTYDIRPAKLFSGVDQRLAIYIVAMGGKVADVLSSRYHRWTELFRPSMFQTIEYVRTNSVPFPNSVPKVDSAKEILLLRKLRSKELLANELMAGGTGIGYFHNAPRYWIRATDFAPYFWNERDGEQISTQVKLLKLRNKTDAQVAVAALNSSAFYWWFLLLSDCRHLNLREIENFPIGINQMSLSLKTRLGRLSASLMTNFKSNCQRKETRYQSTGRVVYDEFDQKPAKPIVDEIDRVLAEHYGFTDEELDFIINYDIKYRMGRDG
jgi:hypothetical protein